MNTELENLLRLAFAGVPAYDDIKFLREWNGYNLIRRV